MKIAVNVVCLTKKTEAKSDDRERSYDFMNAGIQKRKISPFRDASALMFRSKTHYVLYTFNLHFYIKSVSGGMRKCVAINFSISV